MTQNRKNSGGTNGQKRVGRDMLPDAIGSESTRNTCISPLRAAHNPEVVGSSPTAATIISPESADSGEILSVFGTFIGGLFFAFGADPNRDPYGEMSGNYWRAPERMLPIVLAASFFAEVVTWV